MLLNHKHAGLNISGNKLQLVDTVHKDDGLYLENVDEEWFEENIDFTKPESQFVSILQNAFNKILLRKPLLSSNISFTLPFEFFHITRIPYEQTLTNNDLKDHFKWELSVLFPPSSPDDFIVQYIETSKSDIVEPGEAIIIAIKKEVVKRLHKFASKNNLVLKYIDNAHISCNPFIAYANKDYEKGVFCSFYCDENYFSTIILDGKNPIFFSSVKFNELSEIPILLAKEFSRMKKMKINSDLISKYFYCGVMPKDVVVNPIIREFDINIININPFNSLKIKGSTDFTKFHQHENNSFTPATGIALRMT